MTVMIDMKKRPVAVEKSVMKKVVSFLFSALVMFSFAFMLAFGLVQELSANELVQSYEHDGWEVKVWDDHQVIVSGEGILVGYDKTGVNLVAFQVEGEKLIIEEHGGMGYKVQQFDAVPYGDGLMAIEGELATLAFMAISFNEAILVNGKYFDVSGYMDAIDLI